MNHGGLNDYDHLITYDRILKYITHYYHPSTATLVLQI